MQRFLLHTLTHHTHTESHTLTKATTCIPRAVARRMPNLKAATMRSACLLPSFLRSHNNNNKNNMNSTHNNNGFGTHLNCNRSLILICQQGQPIKPKAAATNATFVFPVANSLRKCWRLKLLVYFKIF